MTAQAATVTPTIPAPTETPELPRISGYSLIREKGRGPKAVVYKAKRLFENDIVAVKLFHKGVCDRAMTRQIEAGIQKTEELRHTGLIRALGFGTDDNRQFLVLEYASGESLANFMFRGQQFPPAKALAVVLYCARALKFAADKKVFHGRLHPGRIILGRNNVRIAGVGMGERPEHTAWSVNFPHRFEPLIYTPTEALPSKPFPEEHGPAVDVYSLGAILFQLLTCTPPFKAADEGTLAAERTRMMNPIEWPSGARIAYPKELGNLIDLMLDDDPSKRPTYDKIIQSLILLQAEMQKSNVEGWHGPAAVLTTDARTDGAAKTVLDAAKQFSPTVLHGSAPASSAEAPVVKVPLTPHEKKVDPHPHSVRRHTIYHAKRTVFDVVMSTLLFCMTAVVFLCAIYVTMQPYMPEKYRLVARWIPAAENGSTTSKALANAQQGQPQNAATAAAKIAPDPVKAEDVALAQHQLDKIHEMLLNSDILPSAYLAKVLRGISERAGRTTSTGIRALILASEIESKVSPGKTTEPIPVMPATTPAASVPAAPAAAKTDVPVAASAKPEAPVATKAAPAPALNATSAKNAEAAKPVPGVGAAINLARSQLRYFGYTKAKESLEKFASKGNAEQKRIAGDYRTLISYEEGLYERCHAKLLDHIKRDPKHESLLQVFPRENDPVGDDIIDFDEKGLSILVKGGSNKGVKVTPWDKFPPKQVLNLLLPLSTKSSLEDQIGIAVFAYNRGLAVEAEDALGKAEALPTGKERANAVSDTFVKMTHVLETPE